MAKFNLEQHLRRLELHQSNDEQRHITDKLNAEELALQEQKHLLIALSGFDDLGIDFQEVDSQLDEIQFRPPEEYNCCDISELNDHAWVYLGMMMAHFDQADFEKLSHTNFQFWAILLNEFRCYFVTTLKATEWIWKRQVPLGMRTNNNLISQESGAILGARKELKIVDRYLTELEFLYPDELALPKTKELLHQMKLDQLKFGLARENHETWWFDGESWPIKKTPRAHEWALYVLEEHFVALFRQRLGLKKNDCLELVNRFRGSQGLSDHSPDGFRQRRLRYKDPRLNSYSKFISKHMS